MQYVAKISEKPEKQVIKYFCISASHRQYGLLVELKKQEHISFPGKCVLKIYHCIQGNFLINQQEKRVWGACQLP